VIPRIVATPIGSGAAVRPRTLAPRRVSADVLEAVLPGPGRDRLAAGEVLVVTTGQQPGLFTGPLYTIHKALSAIAIAARLERERRVPVVPVFWVAGDDHDFAEANHATVLDAGGAPARIVLRERPGDAPQIPLWREPCGEEIRAALERVRTLTPDSEFKAAVLGWLEAAYRPEASLSDAFADALHALLAARGLAVFKFHHPAAKRAAAPLLLKSLDLTLPDGLTPVLVEAAQGRDRLRAEAGGLRARRSEEQFTPDYLRKLATEHPERLSPNVLLRPVIEAALFPTVAYAAGPAELGYLPEAAPLYRALGVEAQTPVPRWSGMLVEHRVDKFLEKHTLRLEDLAGAAGALEGRLAREALPPEIVATLSSLRAGIEDGYRRLGEAVAPLDPTLVRAVESTRNAALGGTQDAERKLVASLKRSNETLLSQLARVRHATYPGGDPQERVLTLASFTMRYGPDLLDALAAEVARWADAS
jgi:bacillithiol synthase